MRGPPVCLRKLTAEEASAVESLARSRTAAARAPSPRPGQVLGAGLALLGYPYP